MANPQTERATFEKNGCQSARCQLGAAEKASDNKLLAKSRAGDKKASKKFKNSFKGKQFKKYLQGW